MTRLVKGYNPHVKTSIENKYFSNENNESVTRSEEEFVIILTVCWGRTTRCISVLKNFIKPCMWLQ
jgi:hypothetical protein